MTKKRYVFYELGGRTVAGYSHGKLVERRYLDIVRTETASPDLDTFLDMLRDLQRQIDPLTFDECRVGFVDDNDVGLYFDPSEFLENNGVMESCRQPAIGSMILAPED